MKRRTSYRYRTSEGGSYRIDRRFAGVGRIWTSSGAKTQAGYQARLHLLYSLHERGRADILRLIKAGELSVTEVYEADKEGKLDTLTGDRALLSRNLWQAVEAWAPADTKDATKKRYATSFASLKRTGVLKGDARVQDLEHVDWRTLQGTWQGGPADWNHMRRAVSHFLTVYLNDVHHPFRRSVVKAIPLQKEQARTPVLPPTLFATILEHIPEAYRPAYITVLCLGLRIGEYLRLTPGHLMESACAVQIPGTKTAASQATMYVDARLWPWIVAAVPSPLSYDWLRRYWKRALKAAGAPLDLTLHDIRHCFGQYLANAGVGEARIQVGLRHSTASMTRRYVMQRDQGENAKALADVVLPVLTAPTSPATPPTPLLLTAGQIG
jgi:integrase